MSRFDKIVQVVRFAVIAIVVATSVGAIAGSYRQAGGHEFQDDLSAGEVESYLVGPADLIEPGWRFSCTFGAVQEESPVTAWTTGPWPWQRFATDDLRPRQADHMGRAAGLEPVPIGTNWVAFSGLMAFLVVVAAIVYGPQPRRFTKWGAFWMATLPFGVGQIWLLVAEAPWSRATSALTEPLPHRKQAQTTEGDPRKTWVIPFVSSIVSGLIVNGFLM